MLDTVEDLCPGLESTLTHTEPVSWGDSLGLNLIVCGLVFTVACGQWGCLGVGSQSRV